LAFLRFFEVAAMKWNALFAAHPHLSLLFIAVIIVVLVEAVLFIAQCVRMTTHSDYPFERWDGEGGRVLPDEGEHRGFPYTGQDDAP
jgi:hypothetical protein